MVVSVTPSSGNIVVSVTPSTGIMVVSVAPSSGISVVSVALRRTDLHLSHTVLLVREIPSLNLSENDLAISV